MDKIVSLKPIFDCLVVEQLNAKKETESGILIPETSQQKPNVARVVAKGSDCKSPIEVGDYVVIPKQLQVTTDVEVNGVMQSIIKEENIIAIVNIE